MMKQTNYYSELNNVSLTCDSTMKDMEFNKDIELAISQPSTNSATLDVSNPNVLTYELPAKNAFRINPKPIPMEILRSLIKAERNSEEKAKELKLKSTDPRLKEILISYLTADVYTLPKERLQEWVNDMLIDIQDELEADEYGRPIRAYENMSVIRFSYDLEGSGSSTLAFEGPQSDIETIYDLITNYIKNWQDNIYNRKFYEEIYDPQIKGGFLYVLLNSVYPPKVVSQLMKAFPQTKVHYIGEEYIFGKYCRSRGSDIAFPYNYSVLLNINYIGDDGIRYSELKTEWFTTIEETFSYISEITGNIIAKTKCAQFENETSKTSLFSLPFFS